jgi:hypothetical protein
MNTAKKAGRPGLGVGRYWHADNPQTSFAGLYYAFYGVTV